MSIIDILQSEKYDFLDAKYCSCCDEPATKVITSKKNRGRSFYVCSSCATKIFEKNGELHEENPNNFKVRELKSN